MEGAQRWGHFLAADSRTAQEFRQSWESLTNEARDIWTALGEEQEGVLSVAVESAGGESVTGSTRKMAVQQLEKLRHQLLTKALEDHPDQQARPVMAFPNISDDKCAGAWLLATPSTDLGLSTPVFKEALSAHLCLPSPAVRDGGWVGKAVGSQGEVIGVFGDEVTCCKEIAGDSWRHRHDAIKQHIVSEAALAAVQCDCEVFGLFSDLLPAALVEPGGELQYGRQRQGKVPDFKFLLSTPEGPVPRLAELKVISAGRTWYPRGQGGKGVERRAGRLTWEYEDRLKRYDIRFHGAERRQQGQPEPAPGPLLTRFRGYGGLCQGKLVAGPWGCLSKDFHALLKILAEARCTAIARSRGWEAGPGLLGKVTGELRRAMSVQVVRSQAMCLLERLAQLGPGARAAAERRAATLRLEERRRREAQAFTLAHQNRGLDRVGQAFV